MDTLQVKIPVQQLHLEHELWLNELSFYADELVVLNKFLALVAGKNTGADAMKGVEHFQNQFIRQKEVLDELTHDIRLQEQEVVKTMNNNKGNVEKMRIEDHTDLRDSMNTFKKLYAELKEEFMHFLSKWM